MTAIASNIIKQLGLQPTGSKWRVNGVSGSYVSESYYAVIGIGSTNFIGLKVIVSNDGSVLIGRNLINQWRLDIDGCNKTFIIKPCFPRHRSP